MNRPDTAEGTVHGLEAAAGKAGRLPRRRRTCSPWFRRLSYIVESAPVYPSPKSTQPTLSLKRGDPVAAAIRRLGPDENFFQEKFGRARVVYFRDDQLHDFGWIDTAALDRFYYPAACPPVRGPMMLKGATWEWNECFKNARDAKLSALKAAGATH